MARVLALALLVSFDVEPRETSWFDLDEAVTTRLTRRLRPSAFPRADAIFATACDSALPVAQLPLEKGAKFYLIQHYENWGRSDAEVDASWRLPMHKVVIARWLEEIGDALGEVVTYIPNGVDAQEFPLLVVPEKRAPNTIGLLAHDAEWKGTADGVAAIALVPRALPRDIPHTVRRQSASDLAARMGQLCREPFSQQIERALPIHLQSSCTRVGSKGSLFHRRRQCSPAAHWWPLRTEECKSTRSKEEQRCLLRFTILKPWHCVCLRYSSTPNCVADSLGEGTMHWLASPGNVRRMQWRQRSESTFDDPV